MVQIKFDPLIVSLVMGVIIFVILFWDELKKRVQKQLKKLGIKK